MALQFADQLVRERIIHAGRAVGRRCRYVLARVVEDDVEHLVLVAQQHANALARTGVPNLARPVHAARDDHGTVPVELSAAYFGLVTDQRVYAP